ncbi:MAG: PTS system mannose/fructose/sorbose family transporter subunit IID [Gemmatimonadota bacterium]|jgi:PTS system mannose-specific IID component
MARSAGPGLLATFLRSFVIQGSWNYRTMIGTGFCFALLPSLRRIFKDDPAALERSVRRHVEHFNAHPYLSNVALGAIVRLESDEVDDQAIKRFKTAVRGPLGGLGDSLVWASWLPAVSMVAMSLFWLGAPPWVAVATFVVVYNLGHLGLRTWGFRAGLRNGREVGRSLTRVDLAAWTERLRAVDALLLGTLAGALVGGEGGLVESGALWAGLALVAFVAGELAGQRLWRPTAVAVVAAVALLTTWGLAS